MVVRYKQFLVLIIFFLSQSLQAQHFFDPGDFDKIVASEQDAARQIISFKEASFTDDYDLLHMNAYWKMDPRFRAIEGYITYDFRTASSSMQSIYFDFSDTLLLDSFYYHGTRLESYERPGGDLLKLNLPSLITAGTIDSITIFYHGIPITTGFGSFTQSGHGNDSILWTLSEPYGAKDWFPCKNSLADKIDSVDIRIEIPNQYLAGSNGVLAAIDPVNDSTKVMHWKSHYPIATYLVGISITNYVSFETTCVLESGDSFPVVEYVYPEDSAYYSTHPGTVIPMLQLYSSLFGDYPFKDEKYGHAQWNWGGGEEHQTMSFVTFPDIFELIAHELGHQWFGDKITCGSWQDIWLNEGFATYLAGISYEHLAPAYYKLYLFGRMFGALSDSTGSVFCEDTINVSRIFSGALTYSKGMYLLHMLRWKLGDDAFFTAVYDYINDTSLCYGFARTEDLKQHLESVSGQNLDEFFADWFYGKGAPTYHIQWGTATDHTVAISIHQTQNNPAVSFFEMPLPIQLKDATHDTTIVLQNDVNDLTYRTAPLSFIPDSLFFDPDLWILAKHEIQKNDLLSQPLLLYPNPATDYINISFHSNEELVEEINVYDILGRKMVSLPAGNTSFFDFVKVDISNLSGGLYFVEIKSNANTYLQKIEKY